MSEDPDIPTAKVITLEYGHPARWTSAFAGWHRALGYAAAVIGFGIIIQQLFYAVTALLDLPPTRVVLSGRPEAGLRYWHVGVLIGFALTCALVAVKLVGGGLAFARDKPGALINLRRYATWQIMIVLPNTAFVACIARDIAWTAYESDNASQVRATAIAQALAAIVWATFILFAIRRPSVMEWWKTIEADAALLALQQDEASR